MAIYGPRPTSLRPNRISSRRRLDGAYDYEDRYAEEEGAEDAEWDYSYNAEESSSEMYVPTMNEVHMFQALLWTAVFLVACGVYCVVLMLGMPMLEVRCRDRSARPSLRSPKRRVARHERPNAPAQYSSLSVAATYSRSTQDTLLFGDFTSLMGGAKVHNF